MCYWNWNTGDTNSAWLELELLGVITCEHGNVWIVFGALFMYLNIPNS